MDVEVDAIAPACGVFRVRAPYLRRWLQTYVVRGSSGTLVVDCGPANDQGVLDAIASTALDGVPPHMVLVTHGDADHRGGMAAILARIPGSILISSVEEAPLLSSNSHTIAARYRGDQTVAGRLGQPAIPHIQVNSSPLKLCLGDSDWLLAPLPGHTLGSLAAINLMHGIAISGDAVMRDGIPARDGELEITPVYESGLAYRKSLALLSSFGLSTLLDAHFPPAVGPEAVEWALRTSTEWSLRIRNIAVTSVSSELARKRAALELGVDFDVLSWVIDVERSEASSG